MIAKFDLGDTGCKIVLGMTNLNLNASVLFVTGQVIDINFLIHNSEFVAFDVFQKSKTNS